MFTSQLILKFYRIIKKVFPLWVILVILLIVSLFKYWSLNSTDFRNLYLDIDDSYIYDRNITISFNFPYYYIKKPEFDNTVKFGIAEIDEIMITMIGKVPLYDSLKNIYNEWISDKQFTELNNIDSLIKAFKSNAKSNQLLDSIDTSISVLDFNPNIKLSVEGRKDHLNPLNDSEYILPMMSITAANEFIIMKNFSLYRADDLFFDSLGYYYEHTPIQDEYYTEKYPNYALYYNKKNIYEDYVSSSSNVIRSTLYAIPTEKVRAARLENRIYGRFFTSKKPHVYLNIKINLNANIFNNEYVEDNTDYYSNSEIFLLFRKTPITIQTIYPTPDAMTSDYIKYNTPEKLKLALDNGIIIQGENLHLKEFNDKISFILATFIGILLSLLAGLVITALSRKKKKVIRNTSQRKSSVSIKRKRL